MFAQAQAGWIDHLNPSVRNGAKRHSASDGRGILPATINAVSGHNVPIGRLVPRKVFISSCIQPQSCPVGLRYIHGPGIGRNRSGRGDIPQCNTRREENRERSHALEVGEYTGTKR